MEQVIALSIGTDQHAVLTIRISNIFPSLVMEPSLKNNIYQLVIAHSNDATNFDDFVKGKGKGLIGLLFGPPGSGKTLTAEAVAETAKMPLYMVSSGALGDDPADIEDKLSAILKLASHWKAVLLIDEADVFLAERTPTDIERNAIVSIFLRELEYYQGILLLTTNQAQVIDEAFQSQLRPRHPLDSSAKPHSTTDPQGRPYSFLGSLSFARLCGPSNHLGQLP